MARVTVEDCVVKVPNRFKLVLLAAQRAREITSGAPLTVDRDDDKYPVVALREIADETIGLAHLEDSLVRGMQKHVEIDEPEETHELEVDPLSFAVAAPLAPAAEEDDLVAGLDGDEDDDGEDEAALDEELAEDDLADEIELPETSPGDTEEDLDLADTTPPDELDEEL